MKVTLYDTTLRDGAQRVGIAFSVEDKLRIAKKLIEFEIPYIELGWPYENPKDIEVFKRIKEIPVGNSKIVAFGSTRRKNISPKQDENLKALMQANTIAVAIFGKSWNLHVKDVIKTSEEENLKMIFDSISFLKKAGKEVIYDAEHFFDGFKNNKAYALKTLLEAERAGANCIVLCDTNGGSMPTEIQTILKKVKNLIRIPLGIHAHNDSECAVANSLMAVQEGVTQVQGTVNGYGERCGNANLCSIIPALKRLEIRCVDDDKLRQLTELSYFVSEVSNVKPYPFAPYVGRNAFKHKGGVHSDGVVKNPESYQHIDPQSVGNKEDIVITSLSGKSAIMLKAKELGISLSIDQAIAVLKKVKEDEHKGYHYEAADGSLALLMYKVINTAYKPFFEVEDFNVPTGTKKIVDGIVKIKANGKRSVGHGEGDGPVNALDIALRNALNKVGIDISNVRLTDYKVRVLNSKEGTAAKVSVLTEYTDGKNEWGTVGVSENINIASFEALICGIEYWLIRNQ